MGVFAVRWLKSRIAQSIASVAVVLTAAGGIALAAQDKYTVQVPPMTNLPMYAAETHSRPEEHRPLQTALAKLRRR
jgi:hypothetical protein